MDGIVCDACGEGLLLEGDVRYVVRIEGFAAYDPMELTREDLGRDLEAETDEIMKDLARLDAESAQDQVHRSFSFDLCLRCWQRYVKDPLVGLKDDGKNEKSQGD